ncbi:MAG: type II secretion system protein GspF, partial [Gammaproteobacteria bacterium]|nr:type II secretion system protein GspF [Gammaproteobacteria bacterium]NIR96784.1 type II secretion system protein GspF [Gammaproteobacteria bacterium]NIT62251.1 type II secretion system protein GspF [Gammaproteobacteria bacterium]NIV19424.1 type II secretion system protein GspF [Gammaproteobacteria bacterium]NIY30831.1 type II secretion system protein GspF [Gammaproteobacteria bacterium]
MLAVRSRVKEGHAFAEALGGFPNIFPELYRATVAAGEQTGRLDAVLERLADYTENRHALLQSILQALVYPAVLTVVAIAVVSLLLGYVVPQVVGVFEDIGQELPVLTRALIAVSEFVGDFGLLSMGVVVLAAVAWRLVLRYEGVRERYHRALLSMPLVSRMVRGINAASFARTFSI